MPTGRCSGIIRRLLLVTAAALLCGLALFSWANWEVLACGERVFHGTDSVPENEYGLVLGTSKMTGIYLNRFFVNRMEAAAQLHKAGKIHKIIVSGDNRWSHYNEPEDMRQELTRLGVPPQDILCDYAGRRTLDSVIRARNVFGADSFTVISQPDHCRRAIFIAKGNGIDAVGFAAKDVPLRRHVKRLFREPAACMLAWIDVRILHRRPHFEE